MNDIRWVPFAERFRRNYIAFARRNFGADAYQANPLYWQWLYQENKLAKPDWGDFLLGVREDDDVIACIHKMRIPWRINGEVTQVPALHNLMADVEHRSGIGLMLILSSFTGDEHALIPGVTPPVSDIYEKLKCQRADSAWYRKMLRPVGGGLATGWRMVSGHGATPRRFESACRERLVFRDAACRCTLCPEKELSQRVVAAMNRLGEGVEAAPVWDEDLFQWRFFHPFGPRHLLIYLDDDRGEEVDFIILSLGPRKGLNVARIIDMRASCQQRMRILIDAARRAAIKSGGHAILIFNANRHINGWLKQLGWKGDAKTEAKTFIFHGRKKRIFQTISFCASAGDFGFEAIPPENASGMK